MQEAKSVKTVLEGMKLRIQQGFTKGVFARDKNGVYTDPRMKTAVCWCVLGAARREVEGEYTDEEFYSNIPDPAIDLHSKVRKHLRVMTKKHTGYPNPVAFNDSCTQEEMLAFLDKAIADCEVPL